ncbi:MAG TPA: hypothetical protein VKK81_03455 [Candidatus Binatia bacterium]|nr:hypothetical protein [Candidatus Binatia bacterium]
MKKTNYFIASVMVRRPYFKKEWIEYVLKNPVHTEVQVNGRIRRWALITELGKHLRVVTEPDGETVRNAFPDRGFRPRDGEERT